LTQQAELTRTVMAFAGGPQAGDDASHARETASAWTALRPDKANQARRTIDEIESSGGAWTFAKLTIANAALRELAADGAKRKR
jgi:glutamate dehydrogenase